MILPQRLRRGRRETDPLRDRFGIPGFADAIAVHLVHLHIRHHLGRRNGNEVDVAAAARGIARMNAARREPVANPHGVRAGREGHGKRHRRARFLRRIHERLQLFRIRGDFAGERFLQSDRLTIPVEQERNDHWLLRRTAEAHRARNRHPQQHVRRLNVAGGERVADGGPTRAFGHGGIDAVLLKEALLMRDDDAGTVSQGDDAEFEVGGLRRIAGIDRADPAPGQTGGERGEGGTAEQGTAGGFSVGVFHRAEGWQRCAARCPPPSHPLCQDRSAWHTSCGHRFHRIQQFC